MKRKEKMFWFWVDIIVKVVIFVSIIIAKLQIYFLRIRHSMLMEEHISLTQE